MDVAGGLWSCLWISTRLSCVFSTNERHCRSWLVWIWCSYWKSAPANSLSSKWLIFASQMYAVYDHSQTQMYVRFFQYSWYVGPFPRTQCDTWRRSHRHSWVIIFTEFLVGCLSPDARCQPTSYHPAFTSDKFSWRNAMLTGGSLMLHPRPPTGNAIMKWKNRRPAYRVYVTLNETKLKWFGKDVVAGDEGLSRTSMNTHTRARC